MPLAARGEELRGRLQATGGFGPRPVADDLVDAAGDPARRAGHGLDGHGGGIRADVQLHDPADAPHVERREDAVPVLVLVDALDDGGELGTGGRIAQQGQDHHRPAFDLLERRCDSHGHGGTRDVGIVEDDERRHRCLQPLTQCRERHRGRGPSGPCVPDGGALVVHVPGDLGGEPRLPDLRRTRDEEHPAMAPADLAPGAPEPPQLVFAVDERRERVELGRRRGGELPEHRLRRGRLPAFRDGLDDVHGVLEALERRRPALLESDPPVHGECPLHDGARHQDLARRGVRAEPRRHVERDPPIAVLDRDGLAEVDPDPHREREHRVGLALLRARRLELDGRADGLGGRLEHGERFVAPELDHAAASRLHRVACEVGELRREQRGRRVPSFTREPGVAPDVGDQEGERRRPPIPLLHPNLPLEAVSIAGRPERAQGAIHPIAHVPAATDFRLDENRADLSAGEALAFRWEVPEPVH